MDDETILANFSKDMRESTLKNYKARLSKLNNISGDKGIAYIMTHPKEVYKKLEEVFPAENATRANYITPIAKLFSTNGMMLKKHEDKYDIWKEYLKKERDDEIFRYKLNKPTEKQEKNIVHYEDVVNKYHEMKKDDNVFIDKKTNLHVVLLSVLINLRPKRADLGEVRIFKKDPKADESNYIVLDKAPRIVINVHKMAHKHKAIIEDINADLHEVLVKSLKHYPRKYLFVDNQDQPYDINNSYGQFVRRVFQSYFGKQTGVSLWRHIHVTEKINPLTMNEHELEREAYLMGHSVGQQRVVYRWVAKNQICETTCRDAREARKRPLRIKFT
jgi:hypothetical protein